MTTIQLGPAETIDDIPEICGVAEFAAAAGVKPDTITRYRHRGLLPEPDWTTARQDLWSRDTVWQWIRQRRTS